MMQLGIIGKSLQHSFSPAYFADKMNASQIQGSYDVFELEDIEMFPELIKQHPNLLGLNVTIPYKESIMPFLDELNSTALEVGAVNCIVFDNGKSIGFNTDSLGFQQALLEIPSVQMMQALVLGTGGAAKAVCKALEKLAIPYKKVSRTLSDNTYLYEALNEEILAQHGLIINTTPLGMYPYIDDYPPIPYHFISTQHTLFDLIYNPAKTVFMQKGIMQGAKVFNGLKMLMNQAEINWKIWNDVSNKILVNKRYDKITLKNLL